MTSHNEAGQMNAAPFSAYNYLCTDPPIVALGVMNVLVASLSRRIRPAIYGALESSS